MKYLTLFRILNGSKKAIVNKYFTSKNNLNIVEFIIDNYLFPISQLFIIIFSALE